MFHLALDVKAEYRNMDLAKQVEEITLSYPVDSSKPSPPVVAEYLAEIGAMELLLPMIDRHSIIAAAREVPIDYLAIAERYKVPRVLVERFLGNQYMAALGAFYPAKP